MIAIALIVFFIVGVLFLELSDRFGGNLADFAIGIVLEKSRGWFLGQY